MSDSTIQVSRTVAVGPEALFALLASPSRHIELDGAGMLRGTEGKETPVRGVGDQFVMNMTNSALGDYQMRNTVVAYEHNRTLGWAPELYPPEDYAHLVGDMQARGHTYTWHLEPAGAGHTTVTQVYDWSEVDDEQFRAMFPMLSEQELIDSIDNAAAAARETAG